MKYKDLDQKIWENKVCFLKIFFELFEIHIKTLIPDWDINKY